MARVAPGTGSRADALSRNDNEAMVPRLDQVGICSSATRRYICGHQAIQVDVDGAAIEHVRYVSRRV